MRYIVYSTYTADETNHEILRWGETSPDQISAQALVGQVAVEAPADFFTVSATGGNSIKYFYKPSNGTWSYVEISIPETDDDRKEEIRARIKAALRDSEWTQLPDAPLTSGAIAEITSWRASLRAMPNNPNFGKAGFTWNTDFPFTYKEF